MDIEYDERVEREEFEFIDQVKRLNEFEDRVMDLLGQYRDDPSDALREVLIAAIRECGKPVWAWILFEGHGIADGRLQDLIVKSDHEPYRLREYAAMAEENGWPLEDPARFTLDFITRVSTEIESSPENTTKSVLLDEIAALPEIDGADLEQAGRFLMDSEQPCAEKALSIFIKNAEDHGREDEVSRFVFEDRRAMDDEFAI